MPKAGCGQLLRQPASSRKVVTSSPSPATVAPTSRDRLAPVEHEQQLGGEAGQRRVGLLGLTRADPGRAEAVLVQGHDPLPPGVVADDAERPAAPDVAHVRREGRRRREVGEQLVDAVRRHLGVDRGVRILAEEKRASVRWTRVSCGMRRGQKRVCWSAPHAHMGRSDRLRSSRRTSSSAPTRATPEPRRVLGQPEVERPRSTRSVAPAATIAPAQRCTVPTWRMSFAIVHSGQVGDGTVHVGALHELGEAVDLLADERADLLVVPRRQGQGHAQGYRASMSSAYFAWMPRRLSLEVGVSSSESGSHSSPSTRPLDPLDVVERRPSPRAGRPRSRPGPRGCPRAIRARRSAIPCCAAHAGAVSGSSTTSAARNGRWSPMAQA